MSFLADLDNRTPFAAFHVPLPDGEGGEVVLIVVKASFECAADGSLAPAREQTPVRMVDVPRGEPGRSSPLADHDLALFKPRVDVLVDGRAHAPAGEPAGEVPVELRVSRRGEVLLHKRVVVSGDRWWQDETPSAPAPFVTMPLCWERAFGGCLPPPDPDAAADADERADLRNPVGVGFRGAAPIDPMVHGQLPNLEDPEQRIRGRDDRPTPVGLGPIGRGWAPRLARAGSFDDDWKRRRWPLRPHDYDPTHEQSAPDDQQLEHEALEGEPLELALVNMTPSGLWVLRLPVLDVPINLFYEDRWQRPALTVDTIELEPERRRVTLTGRVAIAVERRRPLLRDIVLGHVTPGWIKARRLGKCHLDFRGDQGRDRSRPCWRLGPAQAGRAGERRRAGGRP